MNDFERDRNNDYPTISYLKTGERIPYRGIGDGRIDLVEWKCPLCLHRWWEYSDEQEYPSVCPMCGCGLAD